MHGVVESELGENHFGIAAYDHKEIVEVVGDAAGEASNGLHFLSLAELIFKGPAIGDVFSDGFEDVGGFVGAADGPAADSGSNDATVFLLPLHLDAVHAPRA